MQSRRRSPVDDLQAAAVFSRRCAPRSKEQRDDTATYERTAYLTAAEIHIAEL
jgi:hypothetical protein